MLSHLVALFVAAGAGPDCPQPLETVSLLDTFLEDREPSPNAIDVDGWLGLLRRYRRIERGGGWPTVEEGDLLRPGARDPRVEVLREHLALAGDLPGAARVAMRPDLLDEDVSKALLRYQARHGLEPTGELDQATIMAMAVPIEERIRSLLVNLERLRLLHAEDLGDLHVWVNVPAFEVTLVEGGRPVGSMRAVVGTLRRRTPTFSDRIEYLEVNPSWVVPASIVWARILPRAMEDPGWLARGGFELRGPRGRVDPRSIDWVAVAEEGRFPYEVRQRPGPGNAMGRVKFMFPNEHGVYLHDTPERALFGSHRRAFSFGCVRVERPKALARFLMRGLPEERLAKVERMIAGEGPRHTHRVDLERPIPVHLVYVTAWVDEWGVAHFREDLYRLDSRLFERLDVECPGWDE